MGTQIGMRRIKTMRLTEGALESIDLKMVDPQHALLVEIVGQFQATGAPGGGALRDDAPYRLVRQHRLLANNRPVQTFDGRTQRPFFKLFDEASWPQDGPTSIADATDEEIRIYHVVPGYMGHSLTGEQFGIVPRAGVEYSLELQLGNAADMVDGLENDVEIANGEIRIYELPYQGDRGPFAPLIIQRYEAAVTQTGEIELDFNTLGPGTEVRAVLIEGLSGGSTNVDFDHDDAVIEDVVGFEVDGEERIKTIPRVVMQGRNQRFYGLTAIETGVVVLDSAENKRTEFGQLWTVQRLRPKLRLSVDPQAGNNKVVVHAIATAGRGRGSK